MSLIAAVEQQSQHVVVSEAVVEGSGERSVVDHSEITVHLGSVGQQQLHQLIPRHGGSFLGQSALIIRQTKSR